MQDKITGQIYRLDKKNQTGAIIGRDGEQYNFSFEDYSGKAELREGHLVRFTSNGKFARNIVLSTGAAKK